MKRGSLKLQEWKKEFDSIKLTNKISNKSIKWKLKKSIWLGKKYDFVMVLGRPERTLKNPFIINDWVSCSEMWKSFRKLLIQQGYLDKEDK